MNKKMVRNIILLFLLASFIGLNVAYGATTVKTSGELHFCQYAGTRRALKAVGYFILIAKILVPIILMAVVMKDLFGVVMSGKSDDLSKILSTSIKRLIAGFIVFIIPSAILAAYDVLGYGDQGELDKCFTCTLDVGKCTVEDDDADDKKANTITTVNTN